MILPSHLGCYSFTSPVYAIIGALVLVGLRKHYMEFCPIGRLVLMCLLHDAVHRGEIRWVSPHSMDKYE